MTLDNGHLIVQESVAQESVAEEYQVNTHVIPRHCLPRTCLETLSVRRLPLVNLCSISRDRLEASPITNNSTTMADVATGSPAAVPAKQVIYCGGK